MSVRKPRHVARSTRRAASASALRLTRSRVEGMTLIEVMVALAIVAIALATGIKAAGALGDNAQRLIDVTSAQWCADNQLTALRLDKQFPGTGESDFACSQLGVSYQGKLKVLPTPNPLFRRVDALVSDERGMPIVTLSTVISRY